MKHVKRAIVLFFLLGAGGFVCVEVRSFDASMARLYEIPLPSIARSDDPDVIGRGKHRDGKRRNGRPLAPFMAFEPIPQHGRRGAARALSLSPERATAAVWRAPTVPAFA